MSASDKSLDKIELRPGRSLRPKIERKPRPSHVGVDDHDAGAGLRQTDGRVNRRRCLPFSRQAGGYQQRFRRAPGCGKQAQKCAGGDTTRPVANGHPHSSAVPDCQHGRYAFAMRRARGSRRRRAACADCRNDRQRGQMQQAFDVFS